MLGGFGKGIASTSTDLYDPSLEATHAWSRGGFLNEGRMSHTTTLLKDGRILAVGGTGSSGPIDSSEIYDPVSDVWVHVANMEGRRSNHTATLL